MYTDLNLDFTQVHPITNDLTRLIDEAAINNAIENLLLTKLGSIPYARDKGTMLSDLVGELYDSVLVSKITDQVTYAINKFEPRVDLMGVDVTGNPDKYTVEIKAAYIIKRLNTAGDFKMTFDLNR